MEDDGLREEEHLPGDGGPDVAGHHHGDGGPPGEGHLQEKEEDPPQQKTKERPDEGLQAPKLKRYRGLKGRSRRCTASSGCDLRGWHA